MPETSEQPQAITEREVLVEKFGALAEIVGRSDESIAEVVLFGSQSKGTNKPDSDIDLAALVDAVTPQEFIGKVPEIKEKIKKNLRYNGQQIGKVPGGVDLEVIRSVIRNLPNEQLGVVAKFILQGISLYARDVKE